MGSFDTYLTRCPDCSSVLEFQTKARYGASGEFEYFATDASISGPEGLQPQPVHRQVPEWMSADLNGDEQTCNPCGRRIKLDAKLTPVRMLNRGRKFDDMANGP